VELAALLAGAFVLGWGLRRVMKWFLIGLALLLAWMLWLRHQRKSQPFTYNARKET
jgi:hypothetical protein